MQFEVSKKALGDSGPIPEGEYLVTIEKAEEVATGATPYIELSMRLENRRMCWDRLYADNSMKAGFVASAAGLTFDGSSDDAAARQLQANDLVGKSVVVELVIDDTKDKPRNKVKAYFEPREVEHREGNPPISKEDIPFC